MLISIVFANAFAADDTKLSRLASLEEHNGELSALIDECKAMGFSLDYEEMNKYILEKYIKYIKEDIDYGDETRVDYTLDCLESIYDETKNALLSYKNGTAEPKEAVRFKISDETADKNSVYADVVSNGEVKKSPVFKIGYVGANDVRAEIKNMKTLGANIVSYTLSMRDVIKPAGFVSGFSEYINSNVRTIEFSQTSDFATDGKKGLKFTATQGSGYDYIYQNVVLEPNTTYEFGADAKSDGTYCAFITVRRAEATGAKIDISKKEETSYNKEFTTGASGGAFQIRIGASKATNGTYIDNLYLRKKGTDDNILINASFEKIVEPYNEEYGIDREILADFVSFLKEAERNDISVSAMINLHEYPKFILNKHQNLAVKFSTYVPYNITDGIILEPIGTFLNEFANTVKNERALSGICLLNEPEYDTRLDKDYYNAYWHSYLRTKHKTIAALNKIYGTSYLDFDETEMPSNAQDGAVFYDWKTFNEQIFADYVIFLRNKVKEVSDIPVYFKTMVSNGYRENTGFVENTDTMLETYASLSDMFGCDAYATYTKKQPLMGKMMQYDLMRSIKDIPIVNAEDHVISDASTDFSPINADHISADMWQGAIHGRSETTVWCLGKSFITTHHKYNSVGTRPDAVSGIGKTALDLMRLAQAVNALKNRPYDAAVLYSDASRTYNKAYLNGLYNVYSAFSYCGKKVRFITENQLKDGSVSLSDYPVLTVACAKNVFDSTVDKISDYAIGGGNVLIFDADSLKYNEYNNLVPEREKIISALKNTETYPVSYDGFNTAGDISQIIYDKTDKLFSDSICVESASGGPSVAYDIVNDGSNTLINICNYSFEDVSVSIKNGGSGILDMTDLISGSAVSENLVLKPYKPMLLSVKSVCAGDFRLYDENCDLQSEASDGIYRAKTDVKNNMFNKDFEAVFFAAVYSSGNGLKDVLKISKNILPGQTEEISIENIVTQKGDTLKLFLWNGKELLNPIK